MSKSPRRTATLLIALLAALSLQLQAGQLPALPPVPPLPIPLPALPPLPLVSFAPGDIFVSLEFGPVQWRTSTGILRGTLAPTVPGTGEGMAFDAAGNLYVARWCTDGPCSTGNTVEKYSNLGQPLGKVNLPFNCQPHAILFDAAGAAYVGQSACRQSILKSANWASWNNEYMVAPENYGVFWMDLGLDGCTMFYTSYGPSVKRYDVCSDTQMADFNAAPLPGGMTQDLRALPDGGVLVSSGQVIARLNSSGVLVQTYEVPGEGALWAGVELVGDGTFWVGNYYTSNVYKFDLATGARLATFNSGTPANSVVAIRIVK
jgi:outer membrane protein assembly factor BamB